jgi:hypothetical protein
MNSPFNENARKCGCLGTGWFDAGEGSQSFYVRCPYHTSDAPSPHEDEAAYIEFVQNYILANSSKT